MFKDSHLVLEEQIRTDLRAKNIIEGTIVMKTYFMCSLNFITACSIYIRTFILHIVRSSHWLGYMKDGILMLTDLIFEN